VSQDYDLAQTFDHAAAPRPPRPAGLDFNKARSQRERLGPADYRAINSAALAVLPTLLRRWLPGGRRQGHEWVARNPRRADRHPGSFCINMVTGRWADFATGDRGDVIALAAYLFNISQSQAARELAIMLGISHHG
jgi:hypothetical protein